MFNSGVYEPPSNLFEAVDNHIGFGDYKLADRLLHSIARNIEDKEILELLTERILHGS